MSNVFVGDVGTEIILNCGVSIVSATSLSIKARKPSGVEVSLQATLLAPNSLKYVTVAGDLDEPGAWLLQAYVDMPSWRGRGGTVVMQVMPAFG